MDYTTDIQTTITTIDKEYKRIAAFFRTFSLDAWKKPTYCPEWNVSQVVGHMTLGGAFYASTVRNGLEGNHGYPLGAKDREEFMSIRISRMNAYAALSGDELVEQFEIEMKSAVELFQSLSPEDYEKKAWHRRGILPIRYFIAQRLNELILHEWDIRNQPDIPLGSNSAKVAVANLRQRFPILYNQNPIPGLEGTYAFKVTDTGQHWTLKIQHEEAGDWLDAAESVDATFSTSASDFLLLVTGRGTISDKEKTGGFRIEGNREKAEAVIPALFFPI